MEGTAQVIRRGDKAKCLKRSEDDTEIDGTIAWVHDDRQHVDIRYGFMDMLSREYVDIKFIKVL